MNRCVAPDHAGKLCGQPATTTVVVEGFVMALCRDHAAEFHAPPPVRVRSPRRARARLARKVK
jgi:ribosome-binding protein aMBF1 (putative translation factor)